MVAWLRYDVLALAGPDHATRCEMFDFIVAELRCREGCIRPESALVNRRNRMVRMNVSATDGATKGAE